MPVFRLHRMKETSRQQFRWAPHTNGVSIARPKDYDPLTTVEASGPYAVWMQLKDGPDALQIGDILEGETGELRIYKYVGFEQAEWQAQEPKCLTGASAEGQRGVLASTDGSALGRDHWHEVRSEQVRPD